MEEDSEIRNLEEQSAIHLVRVSQLTSEYYELSKQFYRYLRVVERFAKRKDFAKRKPEFRRMLRELWKKSDKSSNFIHDLRIAVRKDDALRKRLDELRESARRKRLKAARESRAQEKRVARRKERNAIKRQSLIDSESVEPIAESVVTQQ